jgi:hypothetical protein
MTQPARHDIWQLADRLQMDLRAAQAKLLELRSMLATLDLPHAAQLTCRHCGLATRGPRTLAEHIHVSHNGPLPDHWAAIEARSLEPDEPEIDAPEASS